MIRYIFEAEARGLSALVLVPGFYLTDNSQTRIQDSHPLKLSVSVTRTKDSHKIEKSVTTSAADWETPYYIWFHNGYEFGLNDVGEVVITLEQQPGQAQMLLAGIVPFSRYLCVSSCTVRRCYYAHKLDEETIETGFGEHKTTFMISSSQMCGPMYPKTLVIEADPYGLVSSSSSVVDSTSWKYKY